MTAGIVLDVAAWLLAGGSMALFHREQTLRLPDQVPDLSDGPPLPRRPKS